MAVKNTAKVIIGGKIITRRGKNSRGGLFYIHILYEKVSVSQVLFHLISHQS